MVPAPVRLDARDGPRKTLRRLGWLWRGWKQPAERGIAAPKQQPAMRYAPTLVGGVLAR
jgi:hypothetical protein